MRQIAPLVVLLVISACGGASGGGGTPTAPTPTISSISLTVADIVLVGRTVNATASATMSNGQTQALSTGWQSSTQAVATVTDSGSVRGVANGTSVISISSGGQQASRTIRVAPDYDGNWVGQQIVTACHDSGDLRGICQDPLFQGVIGSPYPIRLTARHPGALEVSGEFNVEFLDFPTFTTLVEEDGRIRFASTYEEPEFRAAVNWVMQSETGGRGGGTIVERYSYPGLIQGEIVFESTFTDLRKTTILAMNTRQPGASARASALRRLQDRIRR